MRKLSVIVAFLFSLPAWSQAVSPPNQSQTTSVRPTISADFNTNVRGARMWVDGTDFTRYLRTQGDSVVLDPPYNLDYGVHQVQVASKNGPTANWSFAIVNPNDSAYRPGYNPTYPYSRTPSYYPNQDPYYNNNPNSNPAYYPTDPYYRNNDDARIRLEDILPAILPQLIPHR